MTDIDKIIAELAELRAKATPEKWHTKFGISSVGMGAVMAGGAPVCSNVDNDDVELIVAMHNYLPELIAEIKHQKVFSTLALAREEDARTNACNAGKERDAANARTEKAEAALRLVAKHQGEHQDAELNLYTRLELAEEHAAQMQADRRWLAEQVVDALGKTLQGKHLMPPEKKGHPITEDKETAITAWVDAAHKAVSKGGEE